MQAAICNIFRTLVVVEDPTPHANRVYQFLSQRIFLIDYFRDRKEDIGLSSDKFVILMDTLIKLEKPEQIINILKKDPKKWTELAKTQQSLAARNVPKLF